MARYYSTHFCVHLVNGVWLLLGHFSRVCVSRISVLRFNFSLCFSHTSYTSLRHYLGHYSAFGPSGTGRLLLTLALFPSLELLFYTVPLRLFPAHITWTCTINRVCGIAMWGGMRRERKRPNRCPRKSCCATALYPRSHVHANQEPLPHNSHMMQHKSHPLIAYLNSMRMTLQGNRAFFCSAAATFVTVSIA